MASVCAAETAPPDWNLIFEDNFDGVTLSNWDRANTNQPTNNSLQDYLPQQVSLSGGNLVITSENIPSRGLPYRSGLVSSKQTWHRGRFEVRADLPTSTGMWPAIWLLPQVQTWPWPSQGEIDIMENRGDQPNLTSSAFHYGTNPPFQHSFQYSEQQTARFGQLVDYHSGMHTYAVEWEAEQLRFYVDDVLHYTLYDDEVSGFLSNQSAPMNLIINTAVGGHFLENPNGSTQWPQQLLVDWVKVYEREETPGTILQRNGSFDEASGSLAGWGTFGSDGQNVSINNEAVLDGVASLKLYGQFNGGHNYSGVTQSISVADGDEVTAAASALIRSADSLSGTNNEVLMKIEFYSEWNGRYGSAAMLDEIPLLIANGSTANDLWNDHSLTATAPEGAVEARLAFVFSQPNFDGGAVHIDGVSFAVDNPGIPGDYNEDGVVNAADYSVWRDHSGTNYDLPNEDPGSSPGTVTISDYQVWKNNFGQGQTGSGSQAAVPEPSGGLLVLLGLAGISLCWRSGW